MKKDLSEELKQVHDEELAELRSDLEEIKNGREAIKLSVIYGDEQLKEVIDALKCNSSIIEWFDMSYNYGISNEGIKSFAEYLKDNKTIIFLKLDCNDITDQGAIELAKALKHNHTLQKLSLLFNDKLGRKGKSALINAMKESNSLLYIEFEPGEKILNTKLAPDLK